MPHCDVVPGLCPDLTSTSRYSKFAGLGNLGIGLMATAMFTKLPAFRNAPLATYWAPAVDTQNEDIKATSNASSKPNEEASEEPVFPVIIFSRKYPVGTKFSFLVSTTTGCNRVPGTLDYAAA